jgi:hypothetical protein
MSTKKYRLDKWDILRKPKSIGGMGIMDLDIQNKCLLSKWIVKLMSEEGTWQKMLKKKYFKDKTLSQVERKKGDSHFWSGLMEVKSLFLERGRFRVHDGAQTRFWEDRWIENEPLMVKYPSLYNIVRKKHALVAQMLSTTPLNVSFRRALVGENWDQWINLVESILTVNLTEHKDTFIWTASKSFLVKNMYNDLVLKTGIPVNCSTWKAKIPLKLKIFLWYVKNGVILTKDNLAKSQWKGCIDCCFCSEYETIQHLFFYCPMARLMWCIISCSFSITKPASMDDLFGP